jgi:hypothetical protein
MTNRRGMGNPFAAESAIGFNTKLIARDSEGALRRVSTEGRAILPL